MERPFIDALTVSKAALVTLIGSAVYSDPDELGQCGRAPLGGAQAPTPQLIRPQPAAASTPCGTTPKRPWLWPWPRPRPRNQNPPEPLDLLLAGAQLEGAAGLRINRPLREVFREAASQLLETGFRQLEAQVEAEAGPV
jgi:hypothetical protein